jgi:hypothetical protein
MHPALLWLGRLAGIAGAVLMGVGAFVRLSGSFWLWGFQVGTLMLAGIGGMVLACLCFLILLVERAGKP